MDTPAWHVFVWHQGVLHSRGGQFIMLGTIDECAEAFIGCVIKYVP